MGWLILILIIAAISAWYYATDENVDYIRAGYVIPFIIFLIIVIYGLCTDNFSDFTMFCFFGLFILGIFGYAVEKKCGVSAQGCKECGRKDSWHIKAEGKDVIDRVYKGQDKYGNAVYYEVADVYYHGRCDNCGYEEEWVERESGNTTY